MEIKGCNGTIEVLDNKIIIKRKGITAFISQGLKGDKEIYIKKITSIQIKNANWITNGYIQFGFSGGKESKGGILDAAKDENTVMFKSSQQNDFLKLKTLIEKNMEMLNSGSLNISNNNGFDIELANRMKKHISEGKTILEAEALAKMELALEKN